MTYAPSLKTSGTVVKAPTVAVTVNRAPMQSTSFLQPGGLSEDTVSFQHPAPAMAQVIQRTEAVLGHNHKILESIIPLVETNPIVPAEVKAQQGKVLRQLLERNKQFRQAVVQDTAAVQPAGYTRPMSQAEQVSLRQLFSDLTHPVPEMAKAAQKLLLGLGLSEEKIAKIQLLQVAVPKKATATIQPTGYTRPVSQVEQTVMKQLFSDLLHPDPEMAKSSKELLLGLGLSEEKIAQIQKAMQERKGKSVQFGGGDDLDELLNDAQKDIINHNSMEQIVQAGVTQHVNGVANTVKPILFGYRMECDGETGSIIGSREPLPGCHAGCEHAPSWVFS